MRIVMTGATAGFGQEAARLLALGGHDLVVGARGAGSRDLGFAGRLVELDCDSLASVRAFSSAVADGPPIDALVCNAGLQFNRLETSADGFERTYAVNHLAHYLMIRLLLPNMAAGGRIVLTGSGTHDPEEKTPVTPPRHANADWLAYPERDPQPEKGQRQAGFRAYSSSKLCNIMTARELAVRHPELGSMAFDPGYVPGTRLGRANPAPIAWLAGKIIPLLMARDRTSTIADSGREHARLVAAPEHAGDRGAYWAMRGGKAVALEPSELARDAMAAAKLWHDSARQVGLT